MGTMTSRISHTTIDSRDAHAQSEWWAEVLGMQQDPRDPNEPGHEECMIFSRDGRTRLLFVEVPEAKELKNRIHFDLRATDVTQQAEIERLLALGATQVADLRTPQGLGWMVLADPEGNEFCVLRSDLEIPDYHSHLIT